MLVSKEPQGLSECLRLPANKVGTHTRLLSQGGNTDDPSLEKGIRPSSVGDPPVPVTKLSTLGSIPRGAVAAWWLPVNYLLLLLGPAQLWQEIVNVGPIIASALAPARQGAASVAETFLPYLG